MRPRQGYSAPSCVLAAVWALGALGAISAWFPTKAAAQRVVVFDMTGPGAARARAALLRVLGDHDVSVTPQAGAVAALSGAETDDARALARVAAALRLDGFITGSARVEGGEAVLEVQLLGADGAPVVRAAFTARRASDLRRAVRSRAWVELGAALGQLRGAAARRAGGPVSEAGAASPRATGRRASNADGATAEGARARDPDGRAADEPSPSGSRRSRRAREAAPSDVDRAEAEASGQLRRHARPGDPRVDAAEYYVCAGLALRRLHFTDDLFDALGSYDLGVAVALATGGAYYPLRGLVAGPVAHLGLEWALLRVLVDDTQNQAGTRFDTSAWSWHTTLRYEAPVGDRLLVSGGFGVGRERFRIEPAGPTSPNGPVESGVPSVRYTFLRVAAGLRMRVVAGLSLGVHAAWRPAIDLGPLGHADWFPRARGHGLEVGGSVGYRVHPVVELRALVEHRRYVADLRPQPGDARVAGGSVDTFLNISLATVVALPSAL